MRISLELKKKRRHDQGILQNYDTYSNVTETETEDSFRHARAR